MPLLESPVELAGLSVRLELANGLRGGNATGGALDSIAVDGLRLVLRGRTRTGPPLAVCCLRGSGIFGFPGESRTIGEGVSCKVLLRGR